MSNKDTDINLNNNNNQNTVSEDTKEILKGKRNNSLFNILLMLLMILILYYITCVLIVKDEFICNNNNICTYKSCGIFDNPIIQKEFQRGRYSLYVINRPKKNSQGSEEAIYIVAFSKSDETEVNKDTFKMFEDAAHDKNEAINKTTYRQPNLAAGILLIVVLLGGIIYFIRRKME